MDVQDQERNKETTEEWVKGIAIGFRSLVEVSFHQRPVDENLREQKGSGKREMRGREEQGGECYPPLWTSRW